MAKFLQIVPDVIKATLQAIITRKIVVYTDGWRGVDVGYDKHFMVNLVRVNLH